MPLPLPYRFLLALAAALPLATPARAAPERVFYEPGNAEAAMAEGQVVLLDFFAPWCTTCRARERVIDRLRDANPAYDETIAFITVDWDTYGQGDLARALAIPRRSTLVAMDGEAELGRVVAATSEADIKALLDLALAAAQAAG